MTGPAPRRLTQSGRVALALMTVTAVAVAGLLPAASSPLRASGRPQLGAVAAPLAVTAAMAARPATGRPVGVADDPGAGLVYRGLSRSDRCAGGFAMTDPGGGVVCTVGPEPAELAGGAASGGTAAARGSTTDVRAVRSTGALYEAAGTTPVVAAASASGAVPCYGDGTSGPRVQAIYAVAADQVDRYATVAPLIASTYAPRADDVYARSAAVGGGVRHVRWATTSDCQLDVLHVVLSSTGDDSFGNTRTELINLGLNRTDRKYLVWVDATVYCGIANVTVDEQPGAANAANRGPTFGRVDSGCWGFTNAVEAHELGHTLGAVQLGAPHSSGSWHCTDEYDRMCYAESSAVTLTYPCPSASESVFDCNGDDYFSVAPTRGSWLADHWNLADSVFLAASEPAPTQSPSATPSPSDSPSATPSPSPTPSTSVVSSDIRRRHRVVTGRLTKEHPRRVVRLTAVPGRVVAVATFHRAPRLQLRLSRAEGKVVGQRLGPSSLRLVRVVEHRGAFRVVVRGAPTHFRLRLDYLR